MTEINPIAWVCPISNLVATASGYTYTRGNKRFPTAPGSYEWLDQDISSADAGRTEDTVMHKELLNNAVKCNLSWNYRHTDEIKKVLNAFDGEYFEVCLYDPMNGTEANDYMARYVMYKGDRSVKMYNTSMGLAEQTSFNIIDTCIKPTRFTVTHNSETNVPTLKKYNGTEEVFVDDYDLFDDARLQVVVKSGVGSLNYYEGGVLRNDLLEAPTGISRTWYVRRHLISGDGYLEGVR